MSNNTTLVEYLIQNHPQTELDINQAKRKFCKKLAIKKIPTNSELLAKLKKTDPGDKPKEREKIDSLLNLLRKRRIRTLSGIAAISVLTKPYPCPGQCAYCPTEKNIPKSYLANEPAVMRALLCQFDPYKQVQTRLHALQNNGHSTDKIELIVIGGTWSYLPEKYQVWYIKECFRAANEFPKTKNKKQLSKNNNQSIKTLKEELSLQQKINETATNRIIGITLETRPDYINENELMKMRQLGCTRIEIGVQHIDNKILNLNKRGHSVDQTIKATALMRQFAFKITYHLMLNLHGSTPGQDLSMCQTVFTDPRFQPDQIKLYPCVVARGALIHHWWKQGQWQPYSTRQLINLLIKIKTITPPWTRIIRVIRDIPEESIIAGNKITNLRQTIQNVMREKKTPCHCIRCREAGHNLDSRLKIQNSKLFIRKYPVLNGTEHFLSYESSDQKILYAFCRLFLPDATDKLMWLADTALIREIHTYGQMAPIGHSGKIQHSGLGKKLLNQAEHIALKKNYQKIAAISGIGVRNYYRRLHYRLKKTYMVKTL